MVLVVWIELYIFDCNSVYYSPPNISHVHMQRCLQHRKQSPLTVTHYPMPAKDCAKLPCCCPDSQPIKIHHIVIASRLELIQCKIVWHESWVQCALLSISQFDNNKTSTRLVSCLKESYIKLLWCCHCKFIPRLE